MCELAAGQRVSAMTLAACGKWTCCRMLNQLHDQGPVRSSLCHFLVSSVSITLHDKGCSCTVCLSAGACHAVPPRVRARVCTLARNGCCAAPAAARLAARRRPAILRSRRPKYVKNAGGA